MPNPEQATNYLDGINYFVPDMQYHSDVTVNGVTKQYTITAPVALSATAILSAQSIASAGSATAFAAGYTVANMSPWGRAVQIVLSGAGTPAVEIRGRDYLGQPIRETITGAGTTPVLGKKAFKYIDSVAWAAVGGTTMNVGTLDVFGVPFCADALLQERVNDAIPANAGVFVAAVKTDPGTATTGDPRGTYAPHTNNAANSSRTYQLLFSCDKNKLHGIKHFYS